ncbi:MAG: PIN domain-containing protein [Coriobacteriia bacterium]|nr:PIN domain-containing protein [Coriobacteriia bacterium]
MKLVRTVVIDTNVLLSQPEAINDFPDALVVIPDTVLSEIDKLKTARVDAELRYKGREISRMLFELSEVGSLAAGVDMPNGGRLRVVALGNENALPEGLSARNADDRILAIALQASTEGCEQLTLVTNDLNMLLKAQTYGITVERIENQDTFARRFIIRPFQRYRVPLTILSIALAVFAAIIYLMAFSPFAPNRSSSGIAALPPEFVDQLPLEQQQVLTLLYKLQTNPKDADSQRQVAILYDQLSESNIAFLPYAIQHYETLLKLAPSDTDTRNDLATAYFRAGRIETAIQEATAVLRQDPSHVNANFNLGVFYLDSKPKQYQKAANQFEKVIRLTQNNSRQLDTLGRARTMLDQVKKDATAAGQPVKLNGGTL